MADYTNWKQDFVPIASLMLDPQNPRIPLPSNGSQLGQRELMAELIQRYDVYELAKDIVDQGYFPTEILVAMHGEDGKAYVLEGNRRLTALKVLGSPDDLAPSAFAGRFRALAKNWDASRAKKVRVVWAPTREDAAGLIIRRHTQKQISSWSTIMQARFFANMRRDGVTVNNIAKEHGLRPAHVTDQLKIDAIYRAALALDLPKDVAEIVHDPHEFPITNLERAINFPATRKFLGADFDKNGELTGNVDQEEFKKGFGRLVTGVAKGEVTSRKQNTATEMQAYLNKIKDHAPDKKKKGAFTSSTLTGEAPMPAVPKKPEKPIKRSTKQRKQILTSPLKLKTQDTRIRAVYKELKELRADEYPNICGAMLRVFLDLAVSNYMDQTGGTRALIAEIKEKEEAKAKQKGKQASPKAKDWSPTLKMMLKYMVGGGHLAMEGQATRALNNLLSGQTIDFLDAAVHHRFTLPNEKQLLVIAETLKPVLDYVLDEAVWGNAT